MPIGTTGQILTADTTVSPYKVKWAAPAAGGTTVKVVTASTLTTYTNSTVTPSNTLTLAITPTAATSKILVLCMTTTSVTTSSSAFGQIDLFNVTQSTAGQYHGTSQGTTTGNWQFPQNAIWLDSPASTSAQTYTMRISKGSSGSGDISTAGYPIVLILMEIGA